MVATKRGSFENINDTIYDTVEKKGRQVGGQDDDLQELNGADDRT